MSINPFCEIAVEEAIRLKEKNIFSQTFGLTIGEKKASETLRHALALGLDEGYHILTEQPTDTYIQPLAVAKLFKYVIEKNKFDIVLLGKQVF
jgi:electron transfer flavoprotein beta subunit